LVATVIVAAVSPNGLHAQQQKPEKTDSKQAQIFVYPDLLTSQDTLLVHGKSSKPIALKSNTRLVWVDRQPGFRFGHSTEFILISEDGTQVVKGSWWPILNGKDLFRDGKKHKVDFPLALPRQKE